MAPSQWTEIKQFRYEVVSEVSAANPQEAMQIASNEPPHIRAVAVILPDGREERCSPVPSGCRVWVFQGSIFALPLQVEPKNGQGHLLPPGSYFLATPRGGLWMPAM